MSVVATAPTSPWKGLAPFEDNDLDALLFFGREREQQVIASNLIASRLTVLYGPSGVGKSSVLRAGVAYRLRATAQQSIEERGHPDLAVVVFDDWRGDPVHDLREAVREALGSLFGPYAVPEVEPDATLAATFAAWTQGLDCELLLILDQVEEYFVYHPDDEADEPFADQLPELVTTRGIRVNALVSLREDALAKLDRFKARIPNVFSNYLRLDRLPRSAARTAVVGPLSRYNELVGPAQRMAIEPAFVDAVIEETTAGRVALDEEPSATTAPADAGEGVETAYLQLVLARIWDDELARGSTTLRLETLAANGGAGEIVRSHVRRALDSLDPRERDVAATIFNYLVTPSGTKIAHSLADLEKYSEGRGDDVDSVVAALSRDRVLRSVAAPGEGNGHTSGYEIFHDVLADPLLVWRRRYEEERALERQRRQAERRHRRQLVISALSFAALAVLAVLTVFAFQQRHEAQQQAALASANLAEAEQATKEAEAQTEETAKALRQVQLQKDRAEAATASAEKQTTLAKDNAEAATLAKADAEEKAALAQRQTRRAITSEQTARNETKKADAAREGAEKSRVVAVEAKQEALRQREDALRQKQHAQARALVGEALGSLSSKPVESVRKAVRAASLERSYGVEDVLRRSLGASRLRAVLNGGGGPITSAEFSPDGSSVLTAAGHGSVRLFRARTATLIRELRQPRVSKATFSPAGRLFALAGAGGGSMLSVDTGTIQHPLPTRERMVDLAFSADGRTIVTASGNTLRAWDVATGLHLRAFDVGHRLRAVAVNRDGTRAIAVPANGGFATLVDISNGTVIDTLEQGLKVNVNSAHFSPIGLRIVTTGTNTVVRVWDGRTGRHIRNLVGHESLGVYDASFSADGESLITAGGDGGGRIWDVEEGTSTSLPGHFSAVLDARLGPPGDQLALTVSRDGRAKVWRTNGLEVIPLLGHEEAITIGAFDRAGNTVLTASDDGTIRLWDPWYEPKLRTISEAGGTINEVVFSHDGRLLAAASADGTVHLLPPAGGSERVLRHAGAVKAVSFSAHDDVLLTASEDTTARVWTREGGAILLLRHAKAVMDARFNPRATLIVTGAEDGRARIWSRSGRLLRTLAHGAVITRVLFSPNGRLVLTVGEDGRGRVWRARDGTLLHVLTGHTGPIVDAAFSPNGRHLATASVDGTARLWSADTGKAEHVLSGHVNKVVSVAFNPAGTRLATASDDNDARVWAVATGKQVQLLRAHFGPVRKVAFSWDGRWLVTAGPGAGGLWEMRPDGLMSYLRQSLPRAPMSAAAFSPSGWRIVTGSIKPTGPPKATVRTWNCRQCQRLPGLLRQARAHLKQIRPHGSARD